VYPVVDAVDGTAPEAHRAGLERITQAGAQPISWVSFACELQRDRARTDTVHQVIDIVRPPRSSRANNNNAPHRATPILRREDDDQRRADGRRDLRRGEVARATQ
jgi:hypothetical protein